MDAGSQDWEDDFPLRDEVEDFSGKTRAFLIQCHEGPFGYTVRAQEEGTDGYGYEFAAYCETTPYAALGRVRKKMRRGLATRHITKSSHGYTMLHDELRGRITRSEDSEPVLVVDGTRLPVEVLFHILDSHEGWGFEFKIVDALE